MSTPLLPNHLAGRWQTGQGEGTRLLASRCRGCGSVYFPRALSCRHPRCTDKALEDVRLGPVGTLYSVTVQAYRPPPLFAMDDWAPYALGLVELPEGLRLMAMLTGRAPHDWRIGEAVILTTEPLLRDGAGIAVLALACGMTLFSERTLVGKQAGVTMLVVLVIRRTKPRVRPAKPNCMARVTMNDGTLVLVTIRPLKTQVSRPSASAAIMPTISGAP